MREMIDIVISSEARNLSAHPERFLTTSGVRNDNSSQINFDTTLMGTV